MSRLSAALRDRLPAYTLFAAVTSAAGLPIYIYAPKYYADSYGVSLTLLGAVLFGLRLFDIFQDPALGWFAERLQKGKALAVTIGAVIMAISMFGLFAVPPPVSPIWWFGITITGLFTAFAFLTINFYAQGIAKAGSAPGGHVRLAAWRESGSLLGVCIAAVTPTLLLSFTAAPFAIFAIGFAVACAIAAIVMWPEWRGQTHPDPTSIGTIVADPLARRLMVLALVNGAPLACSSTLFLFYVESRLGAPGWEGPLLVLFFLAAAVSSPFWGWLARHYGEKPTLLLAMMLALLFFAFTATLGPGDTGWFAVICVLSGATIGADLTLLPAMFARRMAAISPNGGQGFGLWAMVNKFTLAFAAASMLPLLDWSGFQAGQTVQPALAMTMLMLLYAVVPSLLKILAIALLAAIKLEEPAWP